MALGEVWESEPLSGDALAGSGGMGDPKYPSPMSGTFFRDALAAPPLGGMPLSLPPAPEVTGPPVVLPRSAPRARPVPPRDARPRQSARPPQSARPSQNAMPPQNAIPHPTVPPVTGERPWTHFRPPGQTAQQYVTAPTSVSPPRGGPTGPPTVLPPGSGAARVSSAVTQGRTRPARGQAAGRIRGGKSSGAWGFVVFILILLVTSGAGQKIISVISELWQRN